MAEFMDPEVLDDPAAYPSEEMIWEMIEQDRMFKDLSPATSRLMESLFLKARISK
jgi:hypothetical protein